MKHLIIGTAGHVDHGKTALVRALTGVDADRLVEEKRRGLTIDIGFAQLPMGETLAEIVDLPGHADYLGNMLAGAAAVELVLLIVAADEGVMPQTREHLAILSLLGVRRGLVVLTKIDLADEQTRALAWEEIRQMVAGSFLETAPAVAVDSIGGEGIERLRELLAAACAATVEHRRDRPFRMQVDRVFSLAGAGTIATGTVVDGMVTVGQAVAVTPGGLQARVREIRSGKESIRQAAAGQRAALNLAGISKGALGRGAVLHQTELCCESDTLDVWLTVLPDISREIVHGARMHLAIGTAQVVCRVCLLQAETGEKPDALGAGESGPAQLRLEEKTGAADGDRLILRFYSPVETVAGGTVLVSRAHRHGRCDRVALERINGRTCKSLEEQIGWEASKRPQTRQTLRELFAFYAEEERENALQSLLQEQKLTEVSGLVLPPEELLQAKERLLRSVGDYHTAHPLEEGMPLALADCSRELIDAFVQGGALYREGARLRLMAFDPLGTALFLRYRVRVREYYERAGLSPIEDASAAADLALPPQEVARVFLLLERDQTIVRLSDRRAVAAAVFAHAQRKLETLLRETGALSLAQARDLWGCSRKNATALLETLDEKGVTCRQGDVRVLYGSR